jgi:hypothetical protein
VLRLEQNINLACLIERISAGGFVDISYVEDTIIGTVELLTEEFEELDDVFKDDKDLADVIKACEEFSSDVCTTKFLFGQLFDVVGMIDDDFTRDDFEKELAVLDSMVFATREFRKTFDAMNKKVDKDDK